MSRRAASSSLLLNYGSALCHRDLQTESRFGETQGENSAVEEMVGAPGFEPGTSRTPSVRATRLRYAPTAAARHFGRAHPSKRYHLPSSSVKKLRSASRKSSNSLRLRRVAGKSAVACAECSIAANSPPAPFPADSRKSRLAPAIVNPSS